jgi:hypothetical protein
MTPIETAQNIGYGLMTLAAVPLIYKILGFRSIVSIVTIGIVVAGAWLFVRALVG